MDQSSNISDKELTYRIVKVLIALWCACFICSAISMSCSASLGMGGKKKELFCAKIEDDNEENKKKQ